MRKKSVYLTTAKKSLLLLAYFYFGFVAFLYIKQRDFIYFPNKAAADLSIISGSGYSAIYAKPKTQDQLELSGWFFAPSATQSDIILYFHGNAGSIAGRLFKAEPFLRAGYGVLLAEYRGYGGNGGTPTEDGLYADAQAYYQWLIDSGYQNKDIILYGESLGSGVATQLAQTIDPKALVLETPYAAIYEPAQLRFFFIPFIKHIMHDHYASIDKINDFTGPKLFLIADQDEVLGPETGYNLYRHTNDPKTLKAYEAGTHNNLYDLGADQDVLKFLKTLSSKG